MASPLLALPYEIRIYIYELVLCTQGTARLVPLKTRKQRQAIRNSVHTLEPSPNYPPGSGVALGPWITNDNELPESAKDKADGTEFEHLLGHTRDFPLSPWYDGPYQIEEYGISFVDGKVELGPNSLESDDIDDLFNDERGDISESEHAILASLEAKGSSLDRFGYELGAFVGLDVAVLITCREINADAISIFYAGINFVFETDAVKAMRFLKTLPEKALHSITTITLPPMLMDHSDPLCSAGWAASDERTLKTEGPAMETPFGAFLVAEMPKLSDVFVYRHTPFSVPLGGLEVCRWVYTELERLLCHGRIQRLHYLSMGARAECDLMCGLSSEATMSRLLCDAPGKYAGFHEFDCFHGTDFMDVMSLRDKTEYERLKREGWYDRRKEYVRRHSELFDWKWGDRNIGMSCGKVQAVVTAWLK